MYGCVYVPNPHERYSEERNKEGSAWRCVLHVRAERKQHSHLKGHIIPPVVSVISNYKPSEICMTTQVGGSA